MTTNDNDAELAFEDLASLAKSSSPDGSAQRAFDSAVAGMLMTDQAAFLVPQGANLRRRKRGIVLAATVAVGLVFVTSGIFWWSSKPDMDQELGEASEPKPNNLSSFHKDAKQILKKLEVRHFELIGNEAVPIGVLGFGQSFVRVNSIIEVNAEFAEPAYSFLVAVNRDQGIRLVYPREETAKPKRASRIRLKVQDKFLVTKSGFHTLAVVASTEQLPNFAKWKQTWPHPKYAGIEDTGEGVWLAESGRTHQIGGKTLGREEDIPPLLRSVIESLKVTESVEFTGIGFPVKEIVDSKQNALGKPEDKNPSQSGLPANRMLNSKDEKKMRELGAEVPAEILRGNFEKALSVGEQVLKFRTAKQGHDHFQSVSARWPVELCRILSKAGFAKQDSVVRQMKSVFTAERELRSGSTEYERLGRVLESAIDELRKVIGNEHALIARASSNLASLRFKQGKKLEAYRVALETYKRQKAALGDAHPHTLAVVDQISAICTGLGRFKESVKWSEKKTTLVERIWGRESAQYAESLGDCGNALADAHDYIAAEEALTNAVTTSSKVSGKTSPQTLNYIVNLSAVLNNQGQYTLAERRLRTAVEEFGDSENDQSSAAATTFRALGATLQNQGRFDEAAVQFSKSYQLLKTIRGSAPKDHLLCLMHSGINDWQRRNFDKAASQLQLALKFAEHPKANLTVHAPKLKQRLAAVWLETGDFAAAEKLLLASIASYSKNDREKTIEASNAFHTLGALLLKSGRFEESRQYLTQALGIRALRGEDHPLAVATLQDLAALDYRERKIAPALSSFRRAAENYEAARLIGRATGIDRMWFSTRQNPYIGLAMIHAIRRENSKAATSLERALARGLLDDMEASDSGRLKIINEIRNADAQSLKKRTPESIWQRKSLIAQLESDRSKEALASILDLKAIQESIAPEEAVVTWLDIPPLPGHSGDHAVCVLRKEGKPFWIFLADPKDSSWSSDACELASQVKETLVDQTRESNTLISRLVKQRANPLSKALGPVASLPPVTRLVVSPRGDMANVPIQLLFPGKEVVYAPSGSVYAQLMKRSDRRESRQTPSCLALCDPDGSLPSTRWTAENLGHVLENVEGKFKLVSRQKVGIQLTTKTPFAGQQILLLSMHMYHDSSQVFRSWLSLSEGNSAELRFTAAEFGKTKISSELVALAGCSSAKSGPMFGEGFAGFPYSALVAGADSVLATLWDVDQTATALLVSRFFKNLLEGVDENGRPLNKTLALKRAQKWLSDLDLETLKKMSSEPENRGLFANGTLGDRIKVRKVSVRPFEHPYYWSGLILIGDPRPLSHRN